MRNTSKMTTLENRFPLLAVEHGCIISKDADITVAFEVELPELYTVPGAEYEAMVRNPGIGSCPAFPPPASLPCPVRRDVYKRQVFNRAFFR